jgi:hypothetical protein
MAGNGGGYFGGTPSDSVIAFALSERAMPPVAPILSRLERGVAGPVVLPDGPGKVVVERTCGASCHRLDAVLGVRRDRAAWTAMVDNMVARGANAKDNDVKIIVDYLAQHFGK